ncbi:hypothetical protein B0H14DRAFT_2576783 [Mycena olivaceomarginata]|nr:hypothetical protein B0H14DRAFT_2576783 [Mycena olivaceomarginata]
MQTDMHVIITVNPELAALEHDASWIMVDKTFSVHGTTNEWKHLLWLISKKNTGKAINFKVLSKASSLLGAIGDSEGVQAQVFGRLDLLKSGLSSGVFALEAHVDDFVFNCLLGFPYLDSLEEIMIYSRWAHKISYPWLLPSLNRCLISMSKLHWDLTPGGHNPIEGSHVQDNQVNTTNGTLIEAILLPDSLPRLDDKPEQRPKPRKRPMQMG